MSTLSRKRMSLFCVVLMGVLVSVSNAALLCGQQFEWLQDEPGPVDIDCVTGDVYVFNGTANLVAGGEVTSLVAMDGSTVNVHGGIIAGGTESSRLTPAAGAFVTVYAATAEVDAATGQLEITDNYIKNIGPADIFFDLVGTYQDQTPFVIPCLLGTNAMLSLDIPQTAPEIDVLPAMLEWDLGDVEVGQTTTMLVNIYNLGNADLTVSSVTLIGDAAFTLTAGPATPLVIAPNSSVGVDFEVTLAPVAEGAVTATVQVASDDSDEGLVEVALTGNGVILEVPPTQQIQDILDFVDASVAIGTIQGYGPGNSAEKRLNALKNMIESASDLIEAGANADAIDQLQSISKKTDGASKPQDFVVGEAVAELNTMVEALIADLTV